MPSALFISPHLDDAVFSCGGTVSRLARLGWSVSICTVFTASVPDPRGFALSCQTDKGIPASEDYMALRRTEDSAACATLGAEPIHLGHPEAPHRGYGSPAELFSDILPGDRINITIQRNIFGLLRELDPDLVFAPQGLGGHVDHIQVIRAISGSEDSESGFSGIRGHLLHYRDTPYALREPRARPAFREVAEVMESGVDVMRELPDKLRACAAYASQIGFQFGGVEDMREALKDFSIREGRRLGKEAALEAYIGVPESVVALGSAACVEPTEPTEPTEQPAEQRGEP